MSQLNEKDKQTLLTIARNALVSRFEGVLNSHTIKAQLEKFKSETLSREVGSFVTLNKNGELRRCIGYIEPIGPLYKQTNDLALLAAFNDWRFPAVKKSELSDIKIEISVLTIPKLITDVEEIKVGEHGLIIEKKNTGERGLLLPQVATEYGWDRNIFLEQVCRKAELRVNSWKDPDIKLYTFSAEVFSEE